MIDADIEAIELLAAAGLPKADAVDIVAALATVRDDELAKRDLAIDVMTARIAELLVAVRRVHMSSERAPDVRREPMRLVHEDAFAALLTLVNPGATP